MARAASGVSPRRLLVPVGGAGAQRKFVSGASRALGVKRHEHASSIVYQVLRSSWGHGGLCWLFVDPCAVFATCGMRNSTQERGRGGWAVTVHSENVASGIALLVRVGGATSIAVEFVWTTEIGRP